MAYSGKMIFGPSNNYYGINPVTGKQERLFMTDATDYSRFNPESGPEEGAIKYDYWLESERPRFSTPYSYQPSGGTFLDNLVDFDSFQLGRMGDMLKENPERAFLGALDPVGTGLWNKILGEDWDPAVSEFGGPTKKGTEEAAASGVDTKAGAAAHTVAKLIASYFAGQAGAEALSGGEVANSGMDFGGPGVGYDAAGTAGAGTASGNYVGDLPVDTGTTTGYFDSPNTYLADASVTDVPIGDAGSGLPSEFVGDIPVSGQGGSIYGDLATTTNSGGGGVLDSILKTIKGSGPNGSYTLEDLLKVKLIAGGLGLLGARQKERRQEDQAREYDSRTRPYRVQLAELEKDPTAYLTSPAVTGPVQQGTDALARALSVRFGNPTGSGTALQELQNYATTSLAGNLQNEKRRLAALSGIPNAAAAYPAAAQAAIDSERGIYDVAGSTLYDITNPKPTLKQLLEEIYKMNSGGMKLSESGYTGPTR